MPDHPPIAVMLVCGCATVIAAAVGLTGCDAQSRPVSDAMVSIARYPGNAQAALTITCDDGYLDQYTLALPMLDRLGLPATFFVNPGAVADDAAVEAKTLSWARWREVAASGHEIGNHTVTHADLRKLGKDTVAIEREVIEAKRMLEEKLGVKVESFAYPFDARSAAAGRVVEEHHVAVRGKCDFLGHDDMDGAAALAALDQAVRDGAWKVVCLHAVETGFAPLGRNDLTGYLEHAARQREQGKLAIATLARLTKYARQREAATVEVLTYDPVARTCTFRVQGSLDPKVYDVPLTVVVRHAGGPTVVAVTPEQFASDVRVDW
jgi:peptidoglycan/xylan/chitin deacetylase (PgdA/CDA1 family)